MCEFQRHCTKVFNCGNGHIKPVPIVQNLRGTCIYMYTINLCVLVFSFANYMYKKLKCTHTCILYIIINPRRACAKRVIPYERYLLTK